MKVCIICHAPWEIPFDLFSLRNYFEPFVISFSDSVDKLDVELDIKDENEEGDHFTISELDERELLFLFLDLRYLSCLLVEEVSGFSDTLFASSSYELSPALSIFYFASLLELTTGEITFPSC